MRNIKLYSAVFSAIFATGLTYAEPEVSGKITHESASFSKPGTSTGATSSHASSDTFKSETNARIYIDGSIDKISEGATYHLELQAYNDSEAISDYEDNEFYTQRDPLREAYIDTNLGDWAIRAGKQQVVWGTADGAKFLDMINPTDYSEMAQNQMEDSRIPVWMLNSEKYFDNGGQFQVILSQPRENVFAGLNRDINQSTRANTDITVSANSYTGANAFGYGQNGGDTVSPGHNAGQPFILKGVDTISGQKNGFINIVPDIGTIASIFGRAFDKTDNTDTSSTSIIGMSNKAHDNLAMSYFTVGSFNTDQAKLSTFSSNYTNNFDNGGDQGFADMYFGKSAFWNTDANGCYLASGTNGGAGVSAVTGAACTFVAASKGGFYSGQGALSGFAGMFGTSAQLQNTDSTINSVFELMDRTPFATFDAFANAKSQYVLDMPEDDLDLSLRYKNTLENGTNYSLNYSYAYDKNPVINLGWYDNAGNKLRVMKYNQTGSSGFQTAGSYDAGAGTADAYITSVLVLEGGSVSGGYGGYNITNNSGQNGILRFTQTLERAQNLGASFDTTIETDEFGPVVIRGEGVYQKDVYQPVIDRGALSIGDLASALTMRKGDRFKYVIGADITALTNMMVSVQFIQDINLDHIDSNVDFDGSACSAARTQSGYSDNCGVYTLDFASMHLSNGLQKAEKEKEFVSLYLSKPFGESGQHRWNNITMFEENGGQWNRFDVEYTLDDNTIATLEANRYWGDKNTQFGQLEASSNIQIGFKYSF